MYNILCPKWDFNQRPSGKWLKTLMTKWTIIMPSKLKKKIVNISNMKVERLRGFPAF